jgi:hypothetical protein
MDIPSSGYVMNFDLRNGILNFEKPKPWYISLKDWAKGLF